jgi:hypothetical protein
MRLCLPQSCQLALECSWRQSDRRAGRAIVAHSRKARWKQGEIDVKTSSHKLLDSSSCRRGIANDFAKPRISLYGFGSLSRTADCVRADRPGLVARRGRLGPRGMGLPRRLGLAWGMGLARRIWLRLGSEMGWILRRIRRLLARLLRLPLLVIELRIAKTSSAARAYCCAAGPIETHIRNTPNRVGFAGALRQAEKASDNTRRVSLGAMTPSSHRRAVA